MASNKETTVGILKEAVVRLLSLWEKDNKFISKVLVKNKKEIDLSATIDNIVTHIKKYFHDILFTDNTNKEDKKK